MLKRLLIANRGEIACRVVRTCRRLGVHTIAVFSDADRDALHVRLADEAHHIGGAAPAESYLNADRLLDVAKLSNADSIHPGYGFLSENAHFVRRCQDAGLTFVGPSPETMEQMGSKADAKAVMENADVPTVPGYHGAEQSIAILAEQAAIVGYPLMIKAAAGGGGKGMRIVRGADEFESALESAQREAQNAFGDTRVILERYLEEPRHIEVQVFGDTHGNVVHLFERDCSSQRRYQKVIEETPSPLLGEVRRQAMCEAAVAAAKAVDYVNAGTVEFIVDPNGSDGGEFFFMEMNTRLQVEHPVTELVTGQDLVEWQLRVAAGEPLPLKQSELRSKGHAFEARIYAEDADNGFLPSAGTIDWLMFPDEVRIDSGVFEGGEVTVHYDPMIAKLIVHAGDRGAALAALEQALAETTVVGLKSNVDFLLALTRSYIFQRGAIHTAYLDHHLTDIIGEPGPPPAAAMLAAAVAHLMTQEWDCLSAQFETQDPYSPWAIADGWRTGQRRVPTSPIGRRGRRVISFAHRGEHHEINATGFHGNYSIQIGDDSFAIRDAELGGSELSMLVNGQRRRVTVLHREPWFQVAHDGRLYQFVAEDPFAVELSDAAAADRILAPMPGKIVAIKASAGDSVSEGQELIIMEAMKMELTLTAPRDGVIETIGASTDAFVEADTPLLQLANESD